MARPRKNANVTSDDGFDESALAGLTSASAAEFEDAEEVTEEDPPVIPLKKVATEWKLTIHPPRNVRDTAQPETYKISVTKPVWEAASAYLSEHPSQHIAAFKDDVTARKMHLVLGPAARKLTLPY